MDDSNGTFAKSSKPALHRTGLFPTRELAFCRSSGDYRAVGIWFRICSVHGIPDLFGGGNFQNIPLCDCDRIYGDGNDATGNALWIHSRVAGLYRILCLGWDSDDSRFSNSSQREVSERLWEEIGKIIGNRIHIFEVQFTN